MVEDHYRGLGFVFEDGYWVLDLEKYSDRTTYIKEK